MKASFWEGFQKRASEDPLALWLQESEDEQKAIDEKKERPYRVDPRELSEGFPPDTWQRYWP